MRIVRSHDAEEPGGQSDRRPSSRGERTIRIAGAIALIGIAITTFFMMPRERPARLLCSLAIVAMLWTSALFLIESRYARSTLSGCLIGIGILVLVVTAAALLM